MATKTRPCEICMKPIDPASAPADVKAIFDDIKATRNVKDINNFWKYLANEPRMLKQTWESLKAIMGDVEAHGSVRFRDEELNGLPPYVIARKGLGYVPENRDVFPTLTVRQNLLLGMKHPRQTGRWTIEESPLRRAPHTAAVVTGDDWDRPYPRSVAASPLGVLVVDKYWPPVARIDAAYGDRNLMCSCPPLEAYGDE